MTVLSAPPATPSSTWPPEQGRWTYDDWLRLPDDGFRYEILNGELFIAPPPTPQHQDAATELISRMRMFAKEHDLGKVLAAPVGVRLPNQPVPVQPDILFVRKERRSIIGQDYIEGAPDLVVEILSPSNWTYDRKQKFQAYSEAGVQEYWIVDYRKKIVEVFVLEGRTYALINQYGSGEAVRSTALKGFEIKVDDIFAS